MGLRSSDSSHLQVKGQARLLARSVEAPLVERTSSHYYYRRRIAIKLKAFIQRHPVAAYFGMTYLISWVGAFIMVAPKPIRGEAIQSSDGLLMFPVMLIGPALASIM